MAETFTKITASCACTAFELQVDFPTSSLPIDRALCLCRVCRQSSGSCGLSYIGIPSTYSIKPSKFKLTRYDTSESLARYFCSTCGAHVACNPVGEDEWYLSTGLWDQTEGIVNWTGCKWVEDTLDGGISIWLNEILDSSGSKKALKRWVLQERANPEVAFNTLRVFERSEPSEKLKASCHCGGVQFSITRPNAISKEASSPFPDLKVPFHTGLSAANPDNEPWWLMDQDTKYLAGLCTCTSCRLNSGFEIQP